MSNVKERLDVLLVNKNFFESREKARSSIMTGKVFVDGKKVDKCGHKVKITSDIEVKGDKLKYVSRGGLKLEKAIDEFSIDLKDKICFDIGASTGGFTDCMLQNGAKKVFSIDVGYGQIAWELRINPKVVCMERTNIRYITPDDVEEIGSFASIDVSFISLKKVIPAVLNLLNDEGSVVALIKPQFEAGREKVGKKGVVREASTHIEVINEIVDFLIENKLSIINLDYSPIRGPKGNIEYLIYFKKQGNYKKEYSFKKEFINDIVKKAHNSFK